MENEIGSTSPFAANKKIHRPHTMLLVYMHLGTNRTRLSPGIGSLAGKRAA